MIYRFSFSSGSLFRLCFLYLSVINMRSKSIAVKCKNYLSIKAEQAILGAIARTFYYKLKF